MKVMFHWARKNDVIENIPNIDVISKGNVVQKEMYTFNSQQIKKLLSVADIQMRAMIWLGLNCGFGCADCAQLKCKDPDFKNCRVNLASNKTRVRRNLPLWPETIKALKELPRSGQLVFYTTEGHAWIRTVIKTKNNGDREYTSVNRFTPTFSRLMKRVGIHAPKGTGF